MKNYFMTLQPCNIQTFTEWGFRNTRLYLSPLCPNVKVTPGCY